MKLLVFLYAEYRKMHRYYFLQQYYQRIVVIQMFERIRTFWPTVLWGIARYLARVADFRNISYC